MAPALRAGGSPTLTRSPGKSSTPTRSPIELLRHFDVALVVIAAPVGLALGAPAFGLLIGVGAWLVQRVLAVTGRMLIVKAAEPGSRLGLNFIDAFGRIWLLAGAIVVAGAVGSRRDGLAAALLILAAYSLALSVRLARGRAGGPQ